MANELTDAGLDVIAIERGPWRDTATDYPPNYAAGRAALSHPSRAVSAARANDVHLPQQDEPDGTADPQLGAHSCRRNGVGGGGVHWNAETWRFLPSDFVLRTHLTQRYGARFLPARHDDPGLGRHLR